MFALIGIVCYLYIAMHRARERESESAAFSRLMIAGQEAERRRISRELHDAVLPELGGYAGARGGIPDAQALMRRQETARVRIREICAELTPPDFSRLSIGAALAGLCASFRMRTGIACASVIEEGLDFSAFNPAKQLHLYRIVQEALTNIEKHSGARRASLVARRLERAAILVCVSDDGAGLPPERADAPASGLGMRSMRERAAVLGARLDFISESGNGLMVRLEAPL
jgi:two-component system NarL family sensor kinase